MKSRMFSPLRQDDDGGMPYPGLNVHELIDTADRLDAKHGAAILGGTGLPARGPIAHEQARTGTIKPVRKTVRMLLAALPCKSSPYES